MWLLFFLIVVPCLAEQDQSSEECFTNKTTYIVCYKITGRPDACDCSGRAECYIKLSIERIRRPDGAVDETGKYSYMVNSRFQGPTIIADYHAYVVVDVFNDMDEDTSIHWHGMHQVNVPWIDGVGNLTQYPIPARGKFRYIFQAFPQGTHWYHSHMRYQRDHGLFGMLIVSDPQSDMHKKLGEFEDDPELKSFAILDNMKNPSLKNEGSEFCLPDGSSAPANFAQLSFVINNAAKLVTELAEGSLPNQSEEPHLLFYVDSGKKYRFRILGAMLVNMFMISIEDHKMNVIATDGYLVKKFETDFLVVHVAERYDFILEAKEDVPFGKTFAINIQSLAVSCKDSSKVAAKTYAYIVYSKRYQSPLQKLSMVPPVSAFRCTHDKRCKVLNCPFKDMPPAYDGYMGQYMDCYNVQSLQLLYPTIPKYIPSSQDISSTSFFNFRKYQHIAVINGVRFKLPDIPVLENNDHNYECIYPVQCEIPLAKHCTHAVYLNQFDRTARFVLSAISNDNAPTITHPIHMHGHSYFIAKIGYPTYNNNGTISASNTDLTVPHCGAPNWSNGAPMDISVKSNTVRKDVVIVPAGGYVVIEFITDNPGYWFMHCHIDYHLEEGMAIAIGEVPSRASTPPGALTSDTDEFCFSLGTFIDKQSEVNVQVHSPNDS